MRQETLAYMSLEIEMLTTCFVAVCQTNYFQEIQAINFILEKESLK